MDISIRRKGKHKIINFHGDLELFYMVMLKKRIMQELQERPESLVIDMSRNNYMDSTGIAHLTDLHHKMKEMGGSFSLINVPEEIMSILRRTNLVDKLQILTDESDLD